MITVLLIAAGVFGALGAAAGYRYYCEEPEIRNSWDWWGIICSLVTAGCLFAAARQVEVQGIPTMYFGAIFIFILAVEVFASWRGYKRRMKLQSSVA